MIHRMSRHTALVCACAALLTLSFTREAHAAFIGDAITVQVSAGGDTGSFNMAVPGGTGNILQWVLPAPVNVVGTTSGDLLATISSLVVNLDGDPQASVVFGVIAGNAPTAFSISSAVVAFPGINNPQAVASAQLGVTDLNGNGGSVNGTFAGGTKGFEARYNGPTVFANLDSTPVVAAPFGSNSTFEALPPAGTMVIPGVVSNIQVEFNFTLSANDLASGTGVFTVVPEPASMLLAAMGGVGLVALVRRRRRK